MQIVEDLGKLQGAGDSRVAASAHPVERGGGIGEEWMLIGWVCRRLKTPDDIWCRAALASFFDQRRKFPFA